MRSGEPLDMIMETKVPGGGVERCPECGASTAEAVVVCTCCGERLPLRIVLISESSRSGGFALAEENTGTPTPDADDEEADE